MKIIERTTSKQDEMNNMEKKVEQNSTEISNLDKKITSLSDTMANLIFGSEF